MNNAPVVIFSHYGVFTVLLHIKKKKKEKRKKKETACKLIHCLQLCLSVAELHCRYCRNIVLKRKKSVSDPWLNQWTLFSKPSTYITHNYPLTRSSLSEDIQLFSVSTQGCALLFYTAEMIPKTITCLMCKIGRVTL